MSELRNTGTNEHKAVGVQALACHEQPEGHPATKLTPFDKMPVEYRLNSSEQIGAFTRLIHNPAEPEQQKLRVGSWESQEFLRLSRSEFRPRRTIFDRLTHDFQ